MSAGDATHTGERLAAQAPRLRLLLAHLAGPAVRRRVETEDLVQEVFLRALGADLPPPGDDEGDVRLFRLLRRIARNTVVDVARAIRAAKRDGVEERLDRSTWSRTGGFTPAHPGAGPFTRAVGRERGARLEAAFQALSPEHRRVIGFRQFEGLDAAETGRRMGRSATAVHSLYRRALEAWSAAAD
jgi:RNA polymerase sigma factor (sigma-70 family)